MNIPPSRTFSCPACGTRFKWSDQFSGRKTACKCGKVFQAAIDSDIPPADQAYDVIAENPPAPAPMQAEGAGAAPSLSGAAARYGARVRHVETEIAQEESAFKSFYLPIAMIAAGMLFRLGQLLLSSRAGGLAVALGMVGFEIVLGVAIMLLGALIAATVLNVNFGSVGHAALKLCAIAICATAVGHFVASIDKIPDGITGPIVALHIMILMYWGLFSYLFDLDLQETIMSVALIGFLQASVACLMWST